MQHPSEQIEAIFGNALALASPHARSAYLDEVCRDAPDLRLEVESLLMAHDQAGDFLEYLADQAAEYQVSRRCGLNTFFS